MNVLDPFIDPRPEIICVFLPGFQIPVCHARVFLRTLF